MIAIYRALLRLYPAGFRREYGDEMTAIFTERAASAGALGKAGLILEAVPDIVSNALRLHLEILRQDLRYTARTLRRAPGFALTVVLVIALGVGGNTAAFSVADFVLLRPLPYPDSESLVRLCEGPRTGPVGWGCMNELSPANYRDFRDQTRSFEALGAYRRDAVNLVDGGEPQRLESAVLTAEVLPLLGVQPHIGAGFDGPDQDTRTVVIGYGLWQSRFGGSRNVLGTTLNLNGTPHVVIGVMPSSFNFPTRDVQLWTLLQLVEDDFTDRNDTYLQGIGRLSRGVTFEQARADLDLVATRLANEYPETNAETGVSFFRMRDEYSPRFRLMLQALCGASLLILILACANLGNMLLVRAAVRGRELAVRAALGAGRERLARQLITESIVLAAIGGIAGVLVAVLAFPLLSLMVPTTLPIGSEPGLNLRVLVLAALFTTLIGLGFGLLPAMKAGGRSGLTALRGGQAQRRTQRFRSTLVAIEVATSVILLVSSGLLIRAMLRVQATDPGFSADGLLTMRTVLPKPKYADAARRDQFYRDVLTGVRNLPGVQSAAYTSGVPMVMMGGITRVTVPGQDILPDADYSVSRRYVTPNYFNTMGIVLISGRDFEDADVANNSGVAVVSESFAQRYWPSQDPLGRAFLFQDSLMTVIGVVGDVRVRGPERTSEPQMYMTTARVPDTPLTFHDAKDLAIRTSVPTASLVPAVREIIRGVDSEQPVSDIRTAEDVIAQQTAPRATQVRVLTALAALAILLAGLGVYGLLASTVNQRRQEIGVRLALGAQPLRIASGVVRNGLTLALIGMVPGLLVAVAAGRLMSAMLFGVSPGDPWTIALAVALCIAMSVTGALLPALRALRTSPMVVMRSE